MQSRTLDEHLTQLLFSVKETTSKRAKNNIRRAIKLLIAENPYRFWPRNVHDLYWQCCRAWLATYRRPELRPILRKWWRSTPNWPLKMELIAGPVQEANTIRTYAASVEKLMKTPGSEPVSYPTLTLPTNRHVYSSAPAAEEKTTET